MHYRSYAKINLYLDVLRKRDDGFHAIETIFQTISLHDTFSCELTDAEVVLSVSGADLPVDDGNLVVRAARMLQKRYGIPKGARMKLEKSIPVAAGLAGGSGDAAAALIGLNALWEIGASTEELTEIAAELGSDIPYCLLGGTMAGTSRGEILTQMDALPKTWFVLAHPPVEVSTPAIYNDPRLVKSDFAVLDGGMSAEFEEVVEQCNAGDIEGVLFNAMESAALGAYPVIEEYKERLRDAGCGAVLMSGSGPTVFGLCRDETHAVDVQSLMKEIHTSVVHTVEVGVEVI